MYYKGMWQELKENINNEEIIQLMNDLEEKYSDYGEMNKYCPECGKK